MKKSPCQFNSYLKGVKKMEEAVLFFCGVFAFIGMITPLLRATRKVWIRGIIATICIVGAILLCNTLILPDMLERGIIASCFMQLAATGTEFMVRETKGKDSKS